MQIAASATAAADLAKDAIHAEHALLRLASGAGSHLRKTGSAGFVAIA